MKNQQSQPTEQIQTRQSPPQPRRQSEIIQVVLLLDKAVNHYGESHFDGEQLAFMRQALGALAWMLNWSEEEGRDIAHEGQRFTRSLAQLRGTVVPQKGGRS